MLVAGPLEDQNFADPNFKTNNADSAFSGIAVSNGTLTQWPKAFKDHIIFPNF